MIEKAFYCLKYTVPFYNYTVLVKTSVSKFVHAGNTL